ncbi:MAG: 30S ribosomal protein S18 [Endomicrobiaceae bacterium]|jgi:small subunit ribosomal protein S18|nr:30S ribosomal protein S18 [Endomicrobiaceae bacterium]
MSIEKKTARPAGSKPAGKFKKGGPMRRKVCRFCTDKIEIDYKNVSLLRAFVTESGKILSGNVTGTCAKHQRELCQAVKRARMLALLPFSVN